MEKEIHEQPDAVGATLADRIDSHGHLALDEVRIPEHVLRSVDKVIMIGCGTASYAGQVARYAIEHWCRIPVEVELSSEFRYRDPVVGEKTLVVAISQSGETMDTIQAIRHAREQGAKVVAIVNTPGSTISRESDAVILTHAGPEIAVASTKAFTAQVAACYILGLYLAQVRGNKYADEIADYMDKLARVPDAIARILENGETVRQFARTMQDATSVIYLGRHVGFPVALEGALKLKEICYIHAEGFAAGELKHGPIALVDEGQPVLVIVPTPRRPELHGKVTGQHRRGPRPRRPHDRRRRGRGHLRRRVRRGRLPRAPRADPVRAAPDRRAAADLRLRTRHSQGAGRRPAAQPCQVRDRGIATRAGWAPRERSRASFLIQGRGPGCVVWLGSGHPHVSVLHH